MNDSEAHSMLKDILANFKEQDPELYEALVTLYQLEEVV